MKCETNDCKLIGNFRWKCKRQNVKKLKAKIKQRRKFETKNTNWTESILWVLHIDGDPWTRKFRFDFDDRFSSAFHHNSIALLFLPRKFYFRILEIFRCAECVRVLDQLIKNVIAIRWKSIFETKIKFAGFAQNDKTQLNYLHFDRNEFAKILCWRIPIEAPGLQFVIKLPKERIKRRKKAKTTIKKKKNKKNALLRFILNISNGNGSGNHSASLSITTQLLGYDQMISDLLILVSFRIRLNFVIYFQL